jgi:hypothetical protein
MGMTKPSSEEMHMAEFQAVPVLYTDHGSESRKAEEILKAANVDFQSLLIRDPALEGVTVPRLLSIQGFFDTLEDIRLYAELYGGTTRPIERYQAAGGSH